MIERRKNLYGFEMREPDRRRAEKSKRYDIKQLWARNHEILRLALLGHSYKEIAAMLNISPATVSLTLNSELGMKKMSELQLARDAETVDVAREVANLFPQALAIYRRILEDSSGEATLELQKKTADTILMDLGGHRAPSKFQGQVAHAVLTKEDIEALKRRGMEAARAQGILVESTDDKI